MARGWESKSVEAQHEEAAASKSSSGRVRLTATEAERARQIELLDLSRKQVLHQLETSTNTIQRKMLQSALEDLDGRLQTLSTTPDRAPEP